MYKKKKRGRAVLLLAAASLFGICSCDSHGPVPESGYTSSGPVEKRTFRILFEEGGNFTISALEGYDPAKVEEGSDFKFRVTPKEGYEIVSVKIEGDEFSLLPDHEGVYTLECVTKEIKILVEEKILTHKVTFVGGDKFVVTPVEGYDVQNVAHGSDFKFKVVTSEHFELLSVAWGEMALQPDEDGVYTISKVTEDVTISIDVAENTYELKVPSDGSSYTIEFAEEGLDLKKIPYSKEVLFKVIPADYHVIDSVMINGEELTADEEGYFSYKNGEGIVSLTVESHHATYSISFDPNGSPVSIEPQQIYGGELATEPNAPVREADEYYDSYTFDGWYANGVKFDFSKPVSEDATLVAKWSYGNAKSAYVADSWGKSDFVVTGAVASMMNINGATDGMAWENGKVNAEKKQQLLADFSKTDEEGVFWNPRSNDSTATIPSINFKELLKTRNEIIMMVGGYNTFNGLFVNSESASDGRVKISSNAQSEQGVSYLTRTKLTFMLDDMGNVHMGFEDVTLDAPVATYEARSKVGDITLSDAEASGEKGLVLSTNQGGSRYYWIGRPYAFNGGKTVVNVSGKTGFSVDDARVFSKAEQPQSSDKMAPYGQWYDPVCFAEQGIGLLGTNANGPSKLTIDPIDFSTLFAARQGVKFTIGSWNVDSIAYASSPMSNSLGSNGTKASDPYTPEYTNEQIDRTWLNWKVSVDPVFGVSVHNTNENKDYCFPLTEGQLQGKEPLEFDLGSKSNGHFFLLTNLVSYSI